MLERVEAGHEPERRLPAAARAERGSLTASVLGLQRQIGNAAVTRLLQRDAEELQAQSAPTSQRICATLVPSQSSGPPTRLDPLDPIISSVAGPCLDDWAGGYSLVRHRHAPPLPRTSGGFLIQELYQQGSGGSSEHFWECWRVRSGRAAAAERHEHAGDVDAVRAALRRPLHPRQRARAPRRRPRAGIATSRRRASTPGRLPPECGTESPTVDSYLRPQSAERLDGGRRPARLLRGVGPPQRGAPFAAALVASRNNVGELVSSGRAGASTGHTFVGSGPS